MDLSSRLANLSLAEIASMLNSKQQEVLLASISVAARFIQQLQAEEQLNNSNNNSNNNININNISNLSNNNNSSLNLNLSNNSTSFNLTHNNNNQTFNALNQTQATSITSPTSATTDTELDYQTDDIDDDQQVDHSSDGSTLEDYQQQHINTNSTADRETLTIIREFAEELKQRRKSIRLSQKGAAQSLRAFTRGDQPCTDAIIYHFENLQLEPERAIQLIPLLRDWLDWAEKHKFSGKQLPMMSAITKVPRERKRKVVLFNEKAKNYLENAFIKNNHPDRYQLDVISQELNIPTRSIRKWFTNRRQRKRFAEKFSPVNDIDK